MPPSGKLADSIIADFEQWIAAGARDPRAETVVARKKIHENLQERRPNMDNSAALIRDLSAAYWMKHWSCGEESSAAHPCPRAAMVAITIRTGSRCSWRAAA